MLPIYYQNVNTTLFASANNFTPDPILDPIGISFTGNSLDFLPSATSILASGIVGQIFLILSVFPNVITFLGALPL